LRIKEQETHLTLQEHDDDDELFTADLCASYGSFKSETPLSRVVDGIRAPESLKG